MARNSSRSIICCASSRIAPHETPSAGPAKLVLENTRRNDRPWVAERDDKEASLGLFTKPLSLSGLFFWLPLLLLVGVSGAKLDNREGISVASMTQMRACGTAERKTAKKGHF